MTIKTALLALGLATALSTAGGYAFADPMNEQLVQEQHAVSADQHLAPTSQAAIISTAERLQMPSAFGTPGPYYLAMAPGSDGNPHWGPAQDADDE